MIRGKPGPGFSLTTGMRGASEGWGSISSVSTKAMNEAGGQWVCGGVHGFPTDVVGDSWVFIPVP